MCDKIYSRITIDELLTQGEVYVEVGCYYFNKHCHFLTSSTRTTVAPRNWYYINAYLRETHESSKFDRVRSLDNYQQIITNFEEKQFERILYVIELSFFSAV